MLGSSQCGLQRTSEDTGNCIHLAHEMCERLGQDRLRAVRQRLLGAVVHFDEDAVRADGVLVEVHHKPEEALSDGPQSILPEAFAKLVQEVDAIAHVLGRSLQPALAAS